MSEREIHVDWASNSRFDIKPSRAPWFLLPINRATHFKWVYSSLQLFFRLFKRIFLRSERALSARSFWSSNLKLKRIKQEKAVAFMRCKTHKGVAPFAASWHSLGLCERSESLRKWKKEEEEEDRSATATSTWRKGRQFSSGTSKGHNALHFSKTTALCRT